MLIDLNWLLRQAMWPMGLLLYFFNSLQTWMGMGLMICWLEHHFILTTGQTLFQDFLISVGALDDKKNGKAKTTSWLPDLFVLIINWQELQVSNLFLTAGSFFIHALRIPTHSDVNIYVWVYNVVSQLHGINYLLCCIFMAIFVYTKPITLNS